MTQLLPSFAQDGPDIPGNASGINAGPPSLGLASRKAVDEKGFKPMGRIIGWGHAGVEPSIMGVGPVKAVLIALKRAGLDMDDIDVIASQQAFAPKACAVSQALGLYPAKVNPNGSGICLGHPIGTPGDTLVVKV